MCKENNDKEIKGVTIMKIKEYKAPSRMKLESLWDVMLGKAIITDTYVHRDEVLYWTVRNSMNLEQMARTISLGYDYFYGNKRKHYLSVEDFTDWCVQINSQPLKGTVSF